MRLAQYACFAAHLGFLLGFRRILLFFMTTEFFADYQRIFLTFHLLSVAIGLGGATITDLLFFNFLRDFTISKKEAEVMGVLSNVIMGAMLVLFVTGIALYLSDIPRFNVSPAFFAKMVIVAVLAVNGFLMHAYVAPHMIHISFLKRNFKSGHVIHRLRAVAFAMGAVSFTSWYTVFFLSMLKSMLPEWLLLGHMLASYAVVVLVTVIGSQVLQKVYHRRYLFSKN